MLIGEAALLGARFKSPKTSDSVKFTASPKGTQYAADLTSIELSVIPYDTQSVRLVQVAQHELPEVYGSAFILDYAKIAASSPMAKVIFARAQLLSRARSRLDWRCLLSGVLRGVQLAASCASAAAEGVDLRAPGDRFWSTRLS